MAGMACIDSHIDEFWFHVISNILKRYYMATSQWERQTQECIRMSEIATTFWVLTCGQVDLSPRTQAFNSKMSLMDPARISKKRRRTWQTVMAQYTGKKTKTKRARQRVGTGKQANTLQTWGTSFTDSAKSLSSSILFSKSWQIHTAIFYSAAQHTYFCTRILWSQDMPRLPRPQTSFKLKSILLRRLSRFRYWHPWHSSNRTDRFQGSHGSTSHS